eukprot:Pompholyxophrys_punicea_v1_NODE_344_length_2202_cov_2.720670.p1 type:complete len:354 gc:universal NODE_344_length_2202_cov_2.720670:972-2033(+)
MKKTMDSWQRSAEANTSIFRSPNASRMPKAVQEILEKVASLQKTVELLEEENASLKAENERLNSYLKQCIVIENDADYCYLVELLYTILKKKLLKPTDFPYKLMRTQLLCLAAKDARGIRWREFDESIIHWALTIQFYGGGLLVDILRGRSTEGLGSHGKLPINAENWGLFLPPNSTLRSYLPYVNVDPKITDEMIRNARNQLIRSCEPHPTRKKISVGLVADEMEIRKGFVYRKFDHCLVGKASGPVYEDELDKFDWDPSRVRPSFASHILQVFLTTTDGSSSLPLGFIPTTAISGEELHQLVVRVVKIFAETDSAELIWGSTDGFATNQTFLKLMKKERFPGFTSLTMSIF